MKMIPHSDKREVEALSSIDQYRKFIATYERGGWAPIEFDYLDYIDCDKIVSHPVIIEFGDDIGYNFPIGECEYTTDEYPVFNRQEVETRVLPECIGDGFYDVFVDEDNIVNFDDSGLGTHNYYKLKIGQDYYLAKKKLPPVEDE